MTSSGSGSKPNVSLRSGISCEDGSVGEEASRLNDLVNSSSVKRVTPSVEILLLSKMLSGPRAVTPKNEPISKERKRKSD